jgi:hypothetical protein
MVWLFSLAVFGAVLTVMYGVVLLIFRHAFGVERSKPIYNFRLNSRLSFWRFPTGLSPYFQRIESRAVATKRSLFPPRPNGGIMLHG